MNQDSAKKLWTPSEEFVKQSNLTSFMDWLASEKSHQFDEYHELWQWSVKESDDFWEAILEYFDVQYNGAYKEVLKGSMPGTEWFEGLELNYAEHIFRQKSTERPAIIAKSENSAIEEISWAKLEQQVASLQKTLQANGVGFGDRVAAYLPNIPEAIISFLAVNGLGAIWTSTSPDFGTDSVVDRIAQIEPVTLIALEKYQYNGKVFDKSAAISEVIQRIKSIKNVVLVGDSEGKYSNTVDILQWQECLADENAELQLQRVPFDHPIWVLYSSGTTGIPKALTHSCGGMLLEHLKYLSLHNNVKPGDRCFWYTTTGWMMWNYIQASMLCGSTVVLYDGSLTHPNLNVLWQYAEEAEINHFGISAGYITACMNEALTPGSTFDLTALKSIGSTGSPLPPEGFTWIYNKVKKDLWLTSISGGSDVCSAFVGGNPHWPVYAGEIQCRALGCDLDAFDEEGNPVFDEVGEMVIKRPMPSMPIYLWGDENNKRYQESYFSFYPGIWRHGDWTRITKRNGIVIYGRSDSTLNRGGVRIGTSEIYRVVNSFPEIEDSLVINYSSRKGDDLMPLFIKLRQDVNLDSALIKEIKSTIRKKTSPRHVPDEVISIEDIPYTISGKKMETPVKKILEGVDPSLVARKDAMRNPESIRIFEDMAKN